MFTFSAEEWSQIKPHEIVYNLNDKNRRFQNYKTYNSLPKHYWTPVLAEHFWIHTQLPCCLSFKKSNVHPHGLNYITVIGRCTICNSHFKGIISDIPTDNER